MNPNITMFKNICNSFLKIVNSVFLILILLTLCYRKKWKKNADKRKNKCCSRVKNTRRRPRTLLYLARCQTRKARKAEVAAEKISTSAIPGAAITIMPSEKNHARRARNDAEAVTARRKVVEHVNEERNAKWVDQIRTVIGRRVNVVENRKTPSPSRRTRTV